MRVRLAVLLALALAACPEQLPPAQRGVPRERLPPAEPVRQDGAAPPDDRPAPAAPPSHPAERSRD